MMIEGSSKKMFWGFLLFVVGLLWFANDTGLIRLQPFWPIVLMILGVLIFAKGAFYKELTGKGKRR